MLLLTFLGLAAISAVQTAETTIKCFSGSKDSKEEKACDSGVTQCTKTTAGATLGGLGGETITYGCGLASATQEEGCKETKSGTEVLGITSEAKAEVCICTGNLCNSAPSNKFNFIMALSCLMFTFLKISF